MNKSLPNNSATTPASISRRSGRTSKHRDEGPPNRSASAVAADTQKVGHAGMSVSTTHNAATAPPNATPWRHPDELAFIRRDDWTQDLMIDYLTKKSFSIPPNNYRSKDPYFQITPRNGQPVTVPRRYRIPLLYLAKFQWDSLRIVLTASDPVADWDECKYEIIHISRICQHFLDDARTAADIKTGEGLSRTWRSPMLDRLLVRFWNHWFLSEDIWLKAFYNEFDEEEYQQDILEKDWQRWALKGHKGFQLTKEEIANGMTSEQFMDGLTKTYRGWTWASKPISEPKEHPEVDSKPDFPPALSPTAAQHTPAPAREPMLVASGSSGTFTGAQTTNALTPNPPAPAIPEIPLTTPPLGLQSESRQLASEIGSKMISAAVRSTPQATGEHIVDTPHIGNKRQRDSTDVGIDKHSKKAKKKESSPDVRTSPSENTMVNVVAPQQSFVTPTTPVNRKLSATIDTSGDGGPSTLKPPISTTVLDKPGATLEPSRESPAPVAPNGRDRAQSLESTVSSLSNLSSSNRSVSSTPPPQFIPTTFPTSSVSSAEAATPVPRSKTTTPKVPWNAVPVGVSILPTLLTIPPYLPDLGPAPIDRDMSVSPIVRSAASSSARPVIVANIPDSLSISKSVSDGGSRSSSVSNSLHSAESVTTPMSVTSASTSLYQAPFANTPPYSYAPNAPVATASVFPSQTMPMDRISTSFHPTPTPFRSSSANSSVRQNVSRHTSVPTEEQSPSQHPPTTRQSPPLHDATDLSLSGADMNLMNLTGANQSSSATISAFAQAGLPDPHEKTQKLHAALLLRDLLDFMRTSSWKRNQSSEQGERDLRTRQLVLDCDYTMSVDQRFVILRNSVLAIVNRFDGMSGEELEREIADVDGKLKNIFDEAWTALNLPHKEEGPLGRTTQESSVQATPDEPPITVIKKAAAHDVAIQASIEPICQLFESVSIQTDDVQFITPAATASRPSISPDVTMIDINENEKQGPESDPTIKEAMVSIMDMMHNFVENSNNIKGKEREDAAGSPVLSAIMSEFQAMKEDLKKAQQMNREELKAINEAHRMEVRALQEELRNREQDRKAELLIIRSQHRSEVESLRSAIRVMESERERMVAPEDDTRVQPQDIVDLRRRIASLESLPRSPIYSSDHPMASPPLSAASTARSEVAVAPKLQAHPLSHLMAIDGGEDNTPVPFSPRAHMTSAREVSSSKPGTPLSSDRATVSRRDSMDVADEINIPMPVKTQRKPYMFAPRPIG